MPSHSSQLAATSHLLTSEAKIRVRSERRAISLAVVGGYVSPADKQGEDKS